jgi:protein gp37
MGENTKIEWTDATWNPIRARNKKTGKVGWHCEHATTGCINCYAEGFNKRLGTGLPFKPGHRDDIELFLDEEMLLQPLRWKKPRMIFVCSMTDLFADFVPDEWIDKMFAVMALCPQHTFQVLTKRAKRMRDYFAPTGCVNCGDGQLEGGCCDEPYLLRGDKDSEAFRDALIEGAAQALYAKLHPGEDPSLWLAVHAPLPNVWLGVSAERQQEADERVPELLATPAAVRFVSAEPLLGPIDLIGTFARFQDNPKRRCAVPLGRQLIDWVIVGGESGPHARPMHPEWVRSLRDQCAAAGVPFFFKQWGAYLPVGQTLPDFGKVHGATAVKPGRMKLHYGGTREHAPEHAFAERGVEVASTADGLLTFRVGKKAAGRLLDGVEHKAFPAVLSSA